MKSGMDIHNTELESITQRSKPSSRQNECPFELFLIQRTWFPCLQLYVKVRLCWINMHAYKPKSIFLLAIFQKEG